MMRSDCIRRHSRTYATVMILSLCVVGCSRVGDSLQTQPFSAQRTLMSGSAAASGYTIRDLGTLPGDNTSEVGVTNRGGALNNLGQAAGESSHGAWVATLFSNGRVTNVNTL